MCGTNQGKQKKNRFFSVKVDNFDPNKQTTKKIRINIEEEFMDDVMCKTNKLILH
jgi:hypothetical protein